MQCQTNTQKPSPRWASEFERNKRCHDRTETFDWQTGKHKNHFRLFTHLNMIGEVNDPSSYYSYIARIPTLVQRLSLSLMWSTFWHHYLISTINYHLRTHSKMTHKQRNEQMIWEYSTKWQITSNKANIYYWIVCRFNVNWLKYLFVATKSTPNLS